MGFLAHLLDCPKRNVTITAGQKSRAKRVLISGMTADQVAAKLSAILRA
jgi:uncharacterized protein YggU (UPF0235/DUF167 family)